MSYAIGNTKRTQTEYIIPPGGGRAQFDVPRGLGIERFVIYLNGVLLPPGERSYSVDPRAGSLVLNEQALPGDTVCIVYAPFLGEN